MDPTTIILDEARAFISELAAALGLPVSFALDSLDAEATLFGPEARQPGGWSLNIRLAQGADAWRFGAKSGLGFCIQTLYQPAPDGWLPFLPWQPPIPESYFAFNLGAQQVAETIREHGLPKLTGSSAQVRERIARYQAGRDALPAAVEMMVQAADVRTGADKPARDGFYQLYAGELDYTRRLGVLIEVEATEAGPLPVAVGLHFRSLSPEMAAQLLSLHRQLTTQ